METKGLLRLCMIIMLVFMVWLTGILLRHPKTLTECLGITMISFALSFL